MIKKFKRQCCHCREFKQKDELIKITKENVTKEIKLNQNNKYQGRSVYICKNCECIENAFKKKDIEKFLKCSISKNNKEELYNEIKNLNQNTSY